MPLARSAVGRRGTRMSEAPVLFFISILTPIIDISINIFFNVIFIINIIIGFFRFLKKPFGFFAFVFSLQAPLLANAPKDRINRHAQATASHAKIFPSINKSLFPRQIIR